VSKLIEVKPSDPIYNFYVELTDIINKYSVDRNTQDYRLSQHLIDSLDSFDFELG